MVCLLLRPADNSGDILPVISSLVLVSSSLAVTQLVRDRLNLLSGEWPENPARGCKVLEMMRIRCSALLPEDFDPEAERAAAMEERYGRIH